VCEFLRLERTADEITRAVTGASFDRLREIEERDIRDAHVGIFYKPYLRPSIDAGLRFMRAGKAGEAMRALTGEQQQRVAAAFGPLMGELGYGASAPGTRAGECRLGTPS
jgi:hypothetical protein